MISFVPETGRPPGPHAGQHGGGHRAHASGDRRDGSHDGLHLVKGHVPCMAAVRAVVDAHIYHHLARAHIVGPDQVPGSRRRR